MMKDSKYQILKYLAEMSENQHPTQKSFEKKDLDTGKLNLLVDDGLVRRSAGTYFITDKGRAVYRNERVPRLLDEMSDLIESQKQILEESGEVNERMKIYTAILIILTALMLISSGGQLLLSFGVI